MKGHKTTLRLGDLITALYEEISQITTNKSLQAKLVYLALLDLKVFPANGFSACKEY